MYSSAEAQTTKCDLIHPVETTETIMVNDEPEEREVINMECLMAVEAGDICTNNSDPIEVAGINYCIDDTIRGYRNTSDIFLRPSNENKFYNNLEDYTRPLMGEDNVRRGTDDDGFYKQAANAYNQKLGNSDVDFAVEDAAGQFQLRQVVKRMLTFFRRVFIPIAILLITIGAARIYLEQDSDESIKRSGKQIGIIGGGFMLLTFAFTLVENIFFGRQGEILRDTDDLWAQDFAARLVQEIAGNWYINPETNQLVVEWGGLLAYVESFVIPIAVLLIIVHAFRMMTGASDEAITNSGKKIAGVLSGIFLFYILRYLVNFLTTRPDVDMSIDARKLISPTEYQGQIIDYLTDWTNYLIGFLGLIGVAMMIYGGVKWATSYLNPASEESGRKTIIAAVVGLVLAFSAFVIIRYVATPFETII